MTNTTLTRMQDHAVTDRAELDRLLDDTVLAHVGMVDDTGSPVVIPTGIARDGDHILIHGSTGSGWLRGVAAGRASSAARGRETCEDTPARAARSAPGDTIVDEPPTACTNPAAASSSYAASTAVREMASSAASARVAGSVSPGRR